jgi:DNA-binding MarR family transcriptional regulator
MEKNCDIVISLVTLQGKLLKKIDAQLSLHGISFSEFLVMHHLNRAPNKTMRRIDLAEKVGLTASGVTRLLNPMEKIKLVQKEVNPRDARVSLVQLTDAGGQIYSEAFVTFELTAESILQPLSGEQVAAFSELANALK